MEDGRKSGGGGAQCYMRGTLFSFSYLVLSHSPLQPLPADRLRIKQLPPPSTPLKIPLLPSRLAFPPALRRTDPDPFARRPEPQGGDCEQPTPPSFQVPVASAFAALSALLDQADGVALHSTLDSLECTTSCNRRLAAPSFNRRVLSCRTALLPASLILF